MFYCQGYESCFVVGRSIDTLSIFLLAIFDERDGFFAGLAGHYFSVAPANRKRVGDRTHAIGFRFPGRDKMDSFFHRSPIAGDCIKDAAASLIPQ